MERRRRIPKRGGRPSLRPSAVIGVLVLVALLAVPAASVTQASLGRGANYAVVADSRGAVGLDVASSVSKKTNGPLVNVTNNLGSAISVTVALQDGSDGDLYLDGTKFDSQVTFTVMSGDTRTVDIDAANSAGPRISFDVTASSGGIEFSAANRDTRVNNVGGPGGGNCPPNNPNC